MRNMTEPRMTDLAQTRAFKRIVWLPSQVSAASSVTYCTRRTPSGRTTLLPSSAAAIITTLPPSSSAATTRSPVHPTSSVIRHDFECHQTFMNVFIKYSTAPNALLTMKDPTCQLQNNGTHYVISFMYDQCGTTLVSYTDHALVQQEITVHSLLNNVNLVEFSPDYTIPLQCSVNRTKSLHSSFQVVTREPIVEHDRVMPDFDMREFKSELYQDEITQYPVLIPFNREIFFDIVLTNNRTNNGISVIKCEATPTSNPDDATRFVLITNGCSASPAVKVQPKYRIGHFRFSVQAFHFSGSVNQNNMVYVHCYVTTCLPSTCNTTCSGITHRRRRSTRELVLVTLTSGTHIVTNEFN